MLTPASPRTWCLLQALFFVAWLSAPRAIGAETITVDPNTTHQTIIGWEVVDFIPDDTAALRAAFPEVMRQTIDAGFDRIRLEIRSGIENSVDYWTQYKTNQIDYATWRANRYATVNDNTDHNTLNAAGFQWAHFDHMIDSMVLPLRQAAQAKGVQLFVNVNYVAFTSQITTGSYHHSDPDEYAEFVLATYRHLQTKYGWVPDAWEVILEPDNVVQWRNGATIGRAIVAAAAKLQAAGFTPNFIAPSAMDQTTAVTYYDGMATVSGALTHLSEISYHRYNGVSLSSLQALAQRAAARNIGTSMLELWNAGNGFNTLHEGLKLGRNCAYQQGALAGAGLPDNAVDVCKIDTSVDPHVVRLNNATQYTQQYFRYIRRGAKRISASSSSATFDPVAFKNTGGDCVVVIKADNSGSLNIAGLPAGTYGATYTCGYPNNAPSAMGSLPDVTIAAGGTASFVMPNLGVVAVFRRATTPTAPLITTQPANKTVTVGQTASFSVVASGTAPLAYQWQKNGLNISGATGASYTTPATVLADNGATFRCIVSNAAGSITSNAATLTLNAAPVPPTITTQPVNKTVTVGQTATFSVVASGTAPLAYQWQKNGVNITGATSASYTTPATVLSDNGATFRCLVSNSAGSVTSNAATLTVNTAPVAPTITTQPVNKTVTAGQTATFSIVASGTAPLAYQWQKNAVNITGATSASYTTPATTTADNGATFRCIVSNSAGSVTSNAATLTVNAAPVPPTITTQPANKTVTAGQTATFSIVASGTAPLAYQWQKNAVNISGATSASYTTPATTTADNGASFRCIVSNSGGSVTSNAATLTVNAAPVAPTITTQPANKTVTAGQTATFSIVASGTAPLAYQWQKNAVNISGATSASYTTPATTLADNGATFRCVVSNSAGSVTSNAAILTVTSASAPVGHWKLDDGAGVTALDASGNGNHGTLTGGPFWSTGRIAGALSLDGVDDFVNIPDAPTLNATSAVSICAWVRTTNAAAAGIVFSKGTNGFQYYLRVFPGSVRFWLTAGGVGSSYEPAYSVPNNQWLHLAAVYDGSMMRLYVNGAAVGAGLAKSGVITATDGVGAAIGKRAGSTINYFPGLIDDLRLYGRALSAAEISALYSAANHAPTVVSPAGAVPNPAEVGQAVNITVAASDVDGDALSYSWSFGDGATGSGAATTHTYTATGTYAVTATISDGKGGTVQSTVSVVVSNDLLVHWKLDETSGTTAADASGQNNAGTLTTGATWTTGVAGGAISLDGNSGGVLKNPVSAFPSTAITAAFWMKSSNKTKAGTPLSYAVTGRDNEFLIYNYNNFAVYLKGSYLNSGISATDGLWHHIAVSWRSSDGQLVLYKDGVAVWTRTLRAGASLIGGGSLFVGQEQDSVGGGLAVSQAFLGQMDDVRIYKRVLNASEISALANPSPGGTAQVASVTASIDSDGDGLLDTYEQAAGLDPFSVDSDGNDVLDADELSAAGGSHLQAQQMWQQQQQQQQGGGATGEQTIDLGAVKLGKSFRAKLALPEALAAQRRTKWSALDKVQLPEGVKVSSAKLGGKPAAEGVFVFTLVVESQQRQKDEAGKLQTVKRQVQTKYRLTVKP